MKVGNRRKHSRFKTARTIQFDADNGYFDSKSGLAAMEDLGLEGFSVRLHGELPDTKTVTVRIPLESGGPIIEATAERAWKILGEPTQENRYGFLFSRLRSIDYRRIQSFLASAKAENKSGTEMGRRRSERRTIRPQMAATERRANDRRWRLPSFSLYIGGRDFDTGLYEYIPFADKLISEPVKTKEILLRLRNGEVPAETSEYVYGRYCTGDAKHNEIAIEAAHRAAKLFGAFPLSKRVKILKDIQSLLIEHKSALIDLMVVEGHPRRLAEWEFSGMTKGLAAETVEFYKREVIKNVGNEPNERAFLIRKPDGVVCLSPPRNAPCSNSLTACLTFLGGNSLIVKPPLTLAASTIYLWRDIIDKSLRINGAPPGTLNIVVGNTAGFLQQWAENPLVNDVIYFGDSNKGLEIGKKMYLAGKKAILELSGKDILVVWSDADLERAADSLMDCFLGSAQICMVPKMALVHEDVFDRFEKIMTERVRRLRVGLPSDGETLLSPVSKIASFYTFLEDALGRGAELITGGQRLNHLGMPDGKGIYLEPTLLRIANVDKLEEYQLMQEEIFFPLLPLVRVGGKPVATSHKHLTKNEVIFEKMVYLVNANPYGLRASVWCRSDSTVRRFIAQIHNCGLLRINCRHVDFSLFLATHGGTHRTGGPHGELNYVWQKTTHLQGVSVHY